VKCGRGSVPRTSAGKLPAHPPAYSYPSTGPGSGSTVSQALWDQRVVSERQYVERVRPATNFAGIRRTNSARPSSGTKCSEPNAFSDDVEHDSTISLATVRANLEGRE